VAALSSNRGTAYINPQETYGFPLAYAGFLLGDGHNPTNKTALSLASLPVAPPNGGEKRWEDWLTPANRTKLLWWPRLDARSAAAIGSFWQRRRSIWQRLAARHHLGMTNASISHSPDRINDARLALRRPTDLAFWTVGGCGCRRAERVRSLRCGGVPLGPNLVAGGLTFSSPAAAPLLFGLNRIRPLPRVGAGAGFAASFPTYCWRRRCGWRRPLGLAFAGATAGKLGAGRRRCERGSGCWVSGSLLPSRTFAVGAQFRRFLIVEACRGKMGLVLRWTYCW